MATSGHAEANAQPTYSFPLLMPRDIFDTLREWGCPVSETDIRQCNAESIQALYDYFLRTTAPHLRKRVHKKPTPGMLASVSFPEGHMTAFTFRGPQIATGTLLRLCGVHDYTWDDFFEPQPRRLRRILSALINFARFKMEREEAFYEYLAGIDEVDAKIAEAKKRVKAKRQERNALMKKREEARPLEDEVSQQVAELETEINHLNHRQAELRHEITELQHASRRKRDEVSSKNYAVVEADQEIERLLQQIVNSPERFRKSHADAEQRLGEQQSKVSQAEERLYAMRDEVEVYERASAEWDKTLAVLQDAAESVKRCRTAKAEVTRVREKAAENHRILELVTADTKRLEYQNERMREMIERNQRELKERVENMNAKLNMLRDRAREMEKAREGVRQEITRIEMQIKEKDHVSQMEALQFHSDCEEAKQILEHVKLSMERLRSQYMSETEKEIDLE